MRQRAAIRWDLLEARSRVLIVLLGFALLALVIVFVLKWAPELLATGGLKGRDRAEEVGRTRTAVLAALAGLIAIGGAVFTGLSYRLNRSGQITERFTRAIDQLGRSQLDVRLGAIYALERIARNSSEDRSQVIEVLTAYVREHAPWPSKSFLASAGQQASEPLDGITEAIRALERIAGGAEPGSVARPAGPPSKPAPNADDDEPPPLPTDVQAVMSVLGRRTASQHRENARLNLTRTDLRRLVLHADEANLQGADLTEANLEGASLSRSNLQRADVTRANVQDTDFTNANLQRARLTEANLQRAKLAAADLETAVLDLTNLEDAVLNRANLRHAVLYQANLQSAGLVDADLQDAMLDGANLQHAVLIGANLEGASLIEANLRNAVYDASTKWPTADFDADARGAIWADVDPQSGFIRHSD